MLVYKLVRGYILTIMILLLALAPAKTTAFLIVWHIIIQMSHVLLLLLRLQRLVFGPVITAGVKKDSRAFYKPQTIL